MTIEKLLSEFVNDLRDNTISEEQIVDRYCNFNIDEEGELLRQKLIIELKLLRLNGRNKSL